MHYSARVGAGVGPKRRSVGLQYKERTDGGLADHRAFSPVFAAAADFFSTALPFRREQECLDRSAVRQACMGFAPRTLCTSSRAST